MTNQVCSHFIYKVHVFQERDEDEEHDESRSGDEVSYINSFGTIQEFPSAPLLEVHF